MRRIFSISLILLLILLPVCSLGEADSQYKIKDEGEIIVVEGEGDVSFDITVPYALGRLYAASAEQMSVDLTHTSGENVHFGVPFPRHALLPVSGTYHVVLDHIGEQKVPRTWYLQIMPFYEEDTPELHGYGPVIAGKFNVEEPTEVKIEGKGGGAFYDHGFIEIEVYRFDEKAMLIDAQTCFSTELHEPDEVVQLTYTLEPGSYAWHVLIDGDVEYSITVK